jgi:hypothetical protein
MELERRRLAGFGATAHATVRRWLSKIAADLQQDGSSLFENALMRR